MRSWMFGKRVPGAFAVILAIAFGLVGGALPLVPVSSQAITLEAARAPRDLAIDEPWALGWRFAPQQTIPLSAQNIAPPFGGGSVSSLTARALQDGERLYLLLEWADTQADDAVNGIAEFSDAAAVQFPSLPGQAPPFTMGAAGQPVNIWQWKAVWQTDIDQGYATSRDRYPDTYVDDYPNGDDPLYRTAQAVGNPLAQRERSSPVENLLAEGFGTLTHSDAQDVAGAGEWRDGRWRALFVRELRSPGEGYADFAVGSTTAVAFAVWDGAAGDRNGQKAIAPFIELRVGDEELRGLGRFGAEQVLIIVVIALSAAAAGALAYVSSRSNARAA